MRQGTQILSITHPAQRWLGLCILIVVGLLVVTGSVQAVDQRDQMAIQDTYGKVSIAFIPNVGQTDAQVSFLAHTLGGTFFVTPEETVLAWSAPDQTGQTVLRIQFDGANPAAIHGEEPLPGIANFFVGNDPNRWRTNVPTYAGLRYVNLYPGLTCNMKARRAGSRAAIWCHRGLIRDRSGGDMWARSQWRLTGQPEIW